jgi:hypothetical protein
VAEIDTLDTVRRIAAELAPGVSDSAGDETQVG